MPLIPPVTITRDNSAIFQTDSLEYVLTPTSVSYTATLAITFTNTTAQPVYFEGCGESIFFTMEKLVDDTWVPGWAGVFPLCLSPPLVVAPGGTHVFTLRFFGGKPDCKCFPQFTTPNAGGFYRITYQDVYGSYVSDKYGNQLPPELRRTNPFRFLVPVS
jgi:hypothetical protein